MVSVERLDRRTVVAVVAVVAVEGDLDIATTPKLARTWRRLVAAKSCSI